MRRPRSVAQLLCKGGQRCPIPGFSSLCSSASIAVHPTPRQTQTHTSAMSTGPFEKVELAAGTLPVRGFDENSNDADLISSEKRGYSVEHTPDGGQPTDEELQTLRRVAGKVPWTAYTIGIVELCERFSYYGTTAVCMSTPRKTLSLAMRNADMAPSRQFHPARSSRRIKYRCRPCRSIRGAGNGPACINRLDDV